MNVLGVDFTSAPRVAKPITLARCRFDGNILTLLQFEALQTFAAFESLLAEPGPWVGGFDFPFGLPEEAVRELGWPRSWPELVEHCASLGRKRFTEASDRLRMRRKSPNKYAHRATDRPAGSHSPMKCVNPPVGWMFLEGAPRLLRAGVSIPGLFPGDPDRVALEAYPGFAARSILGRRSYKSDDRSRQSAERRRARRHLIEALTGRGETFGFACRVPARLGRRMLDDASGDWLDAAICAMQAAWGWRRKKRNFGMPRDPNPVEGWIVGARRETMRAC